MIKIQKILKQQYIKILGYCFQRTPEMWLINCETILIINWSENYVISTATGKTRVTITDTKIYVPIVTLSTQDNAQLLEQLKSGFKRITNQNKYQ